jgi:hypothetical protein
MGMVTSMVGSRLTRRTCLLGLGLLGASHGRASALAKDDSPVPDQFEIDGQSVAPMLRLRRQAVQNVFYLDVMTRIDGSGTEIWLTDPFLQSAWPHVAMLKCSCGSETREWLLLPPLPRTVVQIDGVRGGGYFSRGAIVGSRFVMAPSASNRATPEEDEWYVQLLLLDGCAVSVADLRNRFQIEKRIVAQSDRASLGRHPIGTEWACRRMVPGEHAQASSLEAELRPIVAPDNRLLWDLIVTNAGPHSHLLFDPFCRHWAMTSFPGRLWIVARDETRKPPRDFFRPDRYISYIQPHRAMCFKVPAGGICGARLDLGQPDKIGDYTAYLELDRGFLCDDRPVDDQGTFIDLKMFPDGESHAPLIRTRPISPWSNASDVE